MSRSLDECEHGTASGHCSYCQEIAEMKRKLAIAKEALERLLHKEYLSEAGQIARMALEELGE